VSTADAATTERQRQPLAFRLYVTAILGVALAFVPAGVAYVVHDPLEAVAWVLFISAASLLTVPMLPKVDVDAGLGAPVSVAAAVILGPPLALVVNLVSVAGERELSGGASLWVIGFNRGQVALSAGAASWAAHHWVAPSEPWGPVASTLVAVVVYNLVNAGAVSVAAWCLGRLGLSEAAKGAAAPFPRFAVDFGLVALLALIVVGAYPTVGVFAVALMVLPLWLGYSALRSARESEDRAQELDLRVRDLETLNALGAELLAARRRDDVPEIGARALRAALESDDVEVSLAGEISPGLAVVKVPGAEPAAVGVPADLGERSVSVAEGIAGLLGMTLQRMELEQELAEVERARSALSTQILEEGTRERSRIALEIHDDVLPYLAAAEIQADNVRSALVAFDRERADRLAVATRDAIHDGIAQLRGVIDALRRQVVVPGGLRNGLLEALEELRLKHGVDGRLHAPEPLPPVPFAVEILLLETVRGCLANVARHAQASRVDVGVDVNGSSIVASVRDDGRGFDPRAVPPGHDGLALMSQRIELARGRFAVRSAPGKGTTVQVEVPV